MSADALPCDSAGLADAGDRGVARRLAPLRQDGGCLLRVGGEGMRSRALDRAESGGWRVRLPASEAGLEAVLMNTGGGMAGGDRAAHTVIVEAGAGVVVTSSAADRVYRSLGPSANVDVRLEVGAGAALVWLPQETIVFDRGRLQRRIEVDVEATGSLALCEITVLGRRAMGEQVEEGLVADRWRVRQGGRLVYAESLRIEGGISDRMAGAAIGGGARVYATLVRVGTGAPDRIEAVRQSLAGEGIEAGASMWNGILVVRLLAGEVGPMRKAAARVMPLLMDRPMPRSWWT